MIPNSISRENILQAIDEINRKGIPENRQAEKYLLEYNHFLYPPKYVISIANQFASNKELDSEFFSGKGFSGGAEANTFLEDRGFRVVKKPSVNPGQKWLIVTSQENWEVCLQNHVWGADENRSNQMKKVRQGDEFLIYLIGMKIAGICKVISDYYYEESNLWKDGIFPHRVRLEPVQQQPLDIKKLFDIYLKYKGTAGGYFGQAIRPIPENEFSIFQSHLVSNTNGLIKWNNGTESPQPDIVTPNKEQMVFVTGYDEQNLDISTKRQILGWAKNSNFMSNGNIVFVFNRTTLSLDSCFMIKSKSDNIDDLIWADERQSNKVIYPNRWNAELIKEDLDIPLSDINKISPFDEEPFQGLLRGNFPMPLNSPQNKDKYEKFRSFLLNSIQNGVNYWIFVVTEKESLSAQEIYRTRMGQKFWGLNEHTGHRKRLRKGDKVIFSHGSKTFIGTALLDSDSFELDEYQRRELSHGNVFNSNYGVMLSNIVTWDYPKKVEDYVEYISFITNKQQYPVYFQGGIKKILGKEYDIITKDVAPDDQSPSREVSLWLVRAGDEGQGESVALEKNLVGIGYGGLPGLDSIREFKAFKEYYIQSHENDSPARVGKVVPQIWSFMYDIKKGDLVVLPLKTKNSQEIAVGQITGDYKYQDLNSEIKQFRSVKWFKKDIPRNEFDPDISGSFDAHGTVYHIGGSNSVRKLKSMLDRLGIGSSPQNRSWLSLTNKEITQIATDVLGSQGKKLEIEDSVIRRIISHLILSKHVILVGPPGSGKTDLARRLLRELGKMLLVKPEPIERVASYEWGRYEVIGGTSISPDDKEDSFHLGCVTHAIKEGKLLLIDEFNRADMNKAFGEMFLAMDHGVIQLKENENPSGFVYKSPGEIEIPSNFRMICTMNDYDKSLLNELSYGLLRRFAFVEIEVPKDKKKLMEIVIERAKRDLRELDDRLLENSYSETKHHIDKLIDFLLAVREKRQIGTSSYIDVVRYVLFGVYMSDINPWKTMNDALIDYIIPQFDRLDFDTLDFAHKAAIQIFKDEKGVVLELQPFLSILHEKVKILQNLSKLFSSEDST